MGLFSRTNVETLPDPMKPGAKAPPPAHPAPAQMPPTEAPMPRPTNAPPSRPSISMVQPERTSHFDQLKVRIHQQLVARLDVQNLRSLPPDTVRAEVRIVIRDLCQSERSLLNSQEQERLMTKSSAWARWRRC